MEMARECEYLKLKRTRLLRKLQGYISRFRLFPCCSISCHQGAVFSVPVQVLVSFTGSTEPAIPKQVDGSVP